MALHIKRFAGECVTFELEDGSRFNLLRTRDGVALSEHYATERDGSMLWRELFAMALEGRTHITLYGLIEICVSGSWSPGGRSLFSITAPASIIISRSEDMRTTEDLIRAANAALQATG